MAAPAIFTLLGVRCVSDFLTKPTGSDRQGGSGSPTQLVFTVQPASVRAGAYFSVELTVEDQAGNGVTDCSGCWWVGLSLGTNPLGATLAGPDTAIASGATAVFQNLSINKASSGYTLVARTWLSGPSGPVTTATSATFDVTLGPQVKLAFTVQPSAASAGVAISPAVAVAIQDIAGNTITTATNAVTLALGANPGNGTLGGTTTVNAVAGIATFTGLSVSAAGIGYTLTASATGLTGATTNAFNVAGPAAKLAFTVQPGGGTGGTALSPAVQVTIQDAAGSKVMGATNAVTLAIGTNPAAGTLSGTLTVTAVSGVATFSNVRIDKAGSGYTLTASATGLTGATSSAFNIGVGAATKLGFLVQPPAAVTVGAAISPAVQVAIQDAGGNTVTTATNTVSVALGSNPGSATLGGTLSVAAVTGVATFSTLTISAIGGAYTLAATATGLWSATSGGFNVAAGAPAKLAFVTQPSTVNAGSAISPAVQVRIQDALGNTVLTATDSVTLGFGANPGSATLGGTVKVAAVNGTATFSGISVSAAGVGYTLTASSGTLTSATSSTFNVIGPAAALAFTVQPTATVAHATLSPAVKVTVQDALGQTVTSASTAITVALGANPGSATLGGTLTANASAGVATFTTLNMSAAGTGYTLTASATGLTSATSATFDVSAFGAPTTLAFLVQPANDTVGGIISPAVQVAVQDAEGNTVTSSNASVGMAFGNNPGSATLGGTLTVAAAAGIATFSNLTVSAAGTGYTLFASSSGLTSATSTAFNVVNPNAPIALKVTTQPTGTVAGSTIVPAVTVAIVNSLGNTVTTATSAVTLTLAANPNGGTLSGTLTSNAVGGVATFSTLSITTAGSGYTLAASAAGLTGSTSAAFNITPGVPSQITIVAAPGPTTAGATIATPLKVAVQDQYGNTVTTATNSVTVAPSPYAGGSGCLAGTLTVAAINGVATFSDLRPRCTLGANGTSYVTGSSPGLTATWQYYSWCCWNSGVTPSVPTTLAFSSSIGTQTANFGFSTGGVYIRDSLGNNEGAGTNLITLSIGNNPGGGTLSGVTVTAASGGYVSFSAVSITKGGSGYTLVASTSGLTSATSNTFIVNAFGAAARLGFIVQPSNTTAGAAITPAVQVAVQDAVGNTVTNQVVQVTIAIGSNPGSGTLGGTVTATTVNGVATFSNLTISAAGTGYTLTATGSGFTTVTSNSFNIN